MPKEISHWILARRALELIEQGTAQEAILKHPDFYDLGAVVYDCPFYALGVKDAGQIAKIADRLHGVHGEDTFEPYRRFLASFNGEIPEEAVSFLAGALTHYAGDTTFHPFVNHFSGMYADDDRTLRHTAQARHRGIEGYMDLFFAGMDGDDDGHGFAEFLRNRGRFARTIAALAPKRTVVVDIVRRFYGTSSVNIDLWSLLRRHALLQRLFFWRGLTLKLRGLALLAGGGLGVLVATFYPVFRKKHLKAPVETLSFFASAIEYRHPNTGAVIKGSVEDFAARMTTGASDLVIELSRCLDRGDTVSFLKGRKGLSLEYGCDAGEYPTPSHFNQSQSVKDLCRGIR